MDAEFISKSNGEPSKLDVRTRVDFALPFFYIPLAAEKSQFTLFVLAEKGTAG